MDKIIKNNPPRFVFWLGTAAVFALMIAGLWYTLAGDPNTLVAIAGRNITKTDLSEKLWEINFKGEKDSPEISSESQKETWLNYLVEMAIIEKEAENRGITASDEEISKKITANVKDYEKYTAEQKDAVGKTARLEVLRDKVKAVVLSYRSGKAVVVRFDRQLAEGKAEDIASDKAYATTLKDSIYADLTAGKITIEQAMAKADNDPRIGKSAFGGNNVLFSHTFTKETSQPGALLFGNQTFTRAIEKVGKGKLSSPVTLKVKKAGGAEVDGIYVIAKVDESYDGETWDYEEWLTKKQNEYMALESGKTKSKIKAVARKILGIGEANALPTSGTFCGGSLVPGNQSTGDATYPAGLEVHFWQSSSAGGWANYNGSQVGVGFEGPSKNTFWHNNCPARANLPTTCNADGVYFTGTDKNRKWPSCNATDATRFQVTDDNTTNIAGGTASTLGRNGATYYGRVFFGYADCGASVPKSFSCNCSDGGAYKYQATFAPPTGETGYWDHVRWTNLGGTLNYWNPVQYASAGTKMPAENKFNFDVVNGATMTMDVYFQHTTNNKELSVSASVDPLSSEAPASFSFKATRRQESTNAVKYRWYKKNSSGSWNDDTLQAGVLTPLGGVYPPIPEYSVNNQPVGNVTAKIRICELNDLACNADQGNVTGYPSSITNSAGSSRVVEVEQPALVTQTGVSCAIRKPDGTSATTWTSEVPASITFTSSGFTTGPNWDFDYLDSVFTNDASGVSVSHTFKDPKTYYVYARNGGAASGESPCATVTITTPGSGTNREVAP